MCRIAGIVSRSDAEQNKRRIQSMVGALAHGGPDDEGIYQHGNVTLGHRRLSIIDLSAAGHQPMIHHSGKLVLSFNGEIYNYLELRSELQAKGVEFRSASDTEVILELYRAYGSRSFTRLRGIFAFAILDIDANKLTLVRDSPGVKPMYYMVNNDAVVFASEVKAFRAYDPSLAESTRWQPLFLAFGYLPHPYTTLNDVYALEPGSVLEIDLKTISVKKVHYATLPLIASPVNEQEALLLVRKNVITALQRNIIADAPLGVFLSGGIDSSLISLLASQEIGERLQTVSVTFEEATLDESPYQKMVLDKIRNRNHYQYKVTEQMFWDAWSEIWTAMDQPTIDGVNSWFVSVGARKAGLKAVLSGLGADELFGGYASSSRIAWLDYLKKLPVKDTVARVAGSFKHPYKRIAFLKLNSTIGDYLFLRGLHVPSVIAKTLNCSESEVWDILKDVPDVEHPEVPIDNYAEYLEFNYYMKGQLLKDTDVMSMRHGLEVRVPFLDQDLINVANSVAKFNAGTQPKYILTKAFEDVIPKEIIFRKKQGFTFPFQFWLKNKLKTGEKLMTDSHSKHFPVDRFLDGKAHWSQVWSGVVLDHFKQ